METKEATLLNRSVFQECVKCPNYTQSYTGSGIEMQRGRRGQEPRMGSLAMTQQACARVSKHERANPSVCLQSESANPPVEEHFN